jgi:hypothetical protein
MTATSALPYLLAAYTFTTILGAGSGAAVPLAALWLVVWLVAHRQASLWSELGVRVSIATSGGAIGLYVGLATSRASERIGDWLFEYGGFPVRTCIGWRHAPAHREGQEDALVWFREPQHFHGPRLEGSAAAALDFLAWFAATLLATAWLREPSLRRAVRPVAWIAAVGLPLMACLGPPLVVAEWR